MSVLCNTAILRSFINLALSNQLLELKIPAFRLRARPHLANSKCLRTLELKLSPNGLTIPAIYSCISGSVSSLPQTGRITYGKKKCGLKKHYIGRRTKKPFKLVAKGWDSHFTYLFTVPYVQSELFFFF